MKSALEEIGCKKYGEWAEEKEKSGETVKDWSIREGIENADVETAVYFISDLLGDYRNAKYSLMSLLNKEEKVGWAQKWVDSSKVLQNDKINPEKYLNIQQLIKDVESLGDWKDPLEKNNYLKILSKITSVYHGYEIDSDMGKTKGHYPNDVLKAMSNICAEKFPSFEEIFDENGNLKPGMPDDNQYCNYVASASTPLGISFLGERTNISNVAKEKFGIDVFHTKSTEDEVKEMIMSSQRYLEKDMDKSNIPYYQVAKQALMNWNGLTSEEADKVISEQTFSEIEGQVYAKESMENAIDGILHSLKLPYSDRSELIDGVFYGEDKENGLNSIKDKITSAGKDKNDVIMDTIFTVHDGWVRDNKKKFNARDKKHQHMPSELIGWKESKADLLFIRPIFETAGIDVNEEELEQVYNERVKKFFLDKGISTTKDLVDNITKGEEFYSSLSGYGDILSDISDSNYVEKNIIPAIENQGIGKVEDVRKQVVSQVVNNLDPNDLSKLTEEEKVQIEKELGQGVDNLSQQKDELKEKNEIVGRIISLVKEREKVKSEIAVEEEQKKKNIQEF